MTIKVVCIGLDPEHDVFREISLYQTRAYWHLGSVYVGLLVAASILLLAKIGGKTEAALEREPLFQQLVGLTALLGMLFLSPIHHGVAHDVLAVTAMIGYSFYLCWFAISHGDQFLKRLGCCMMGLGVIVVPLVDSPVFGVVENLLLLTQLMGFLHVYYRMLEEREPFAEPRGWRSSNDRRIPIGRREVAELRRKRPRHKRPVTDEIQTIWFGSSRRP